MLKIKTSIPNQCTKAHASDAAYDIIASEEMVVFPGERELISTDLYMAIPEGWVGIIKSRSGLSSKHCLDIGAGVIDPGYTGEVKVLMINNGGDWYRVRAGDKIAQILIIPCYPSNEIVRVDNLEDTARGSNGFNSTGY